MSLAYYPGCSGLSTSTDYEQSTRAICAALGVEVREIPDWNCCGASPGHITDLVLSASLSARNLGQAKDAGCDKVFTPCPSCLTNLKHAHHNIQDPAFRAKVERIIERSADDLPETFGILQILLEEVGLEKIKSLVKKPLAGIKVVPYYGCIMTRPAEVMRFDDVENPVSMDGILEALGAEVLPYPLKVECCGASSGVPRREVTARLSGRLLSAAKAAGADAMVVACPLCQMNLDLRQKQAEKAAGETFDMPVFYITQMLGLAFGLDTKTLGIDKLNASPDKVLEKHAQGGRA